MDSIFLSITGGVMLLSLFFTITPQLHMLQLNSYYNKRFIDYLKGAKKGSALWSFVFAAAAVLFCFISPFVAMLVTVLTCPVRVARAVYKTKHAKKKIVFTGRVKRMYATLFVLCLLIGLTALLPHLFVPLCAAVLCFSPLTAMLLNLINAPAEYAVRQYYIRDAEKILQSCPDMQIIGLTGSYGKTSTKYILGRILSEQYNTLVTPGSFNTPMGIVRTVREHLKPGTQIFVAEMGAKKTGDIKEICDIVHPINGILTSIGPQHLNTFGTLDNIIHTKFELADAVNEKGGCMYFNFDNPYIKQKALQSHYRYKSYSTSDPTCDAYAKNIQSSRSGLSFAIVTKDETIPVSTRLLGAHNVLNILAAVLIALDFGITPDNIRYAVEQLEPYEHRLQLKPFFGGALLIDDAYNANPSGSLEAMRVLGSFYPMTRIAVTPGLVELGEKEIECNEALGAEAAQNADILIFVGIERAKPLERGALKSGFPPQNLHIVKTFNDAAQMLRTLCNKETVVLFENDLPDNYAK